jgi:hypothetical protein
MAGIAQSLPSWVSPATTVAGTALTAGSQIGAGIAARRAGDYQAQQADIAAGQQQAAAQRTAQTVDRQSKVLQSRALAVAAASGGGASDPTVVDLVSRIAGEGAYRSQLALYEGNDAARTLQMRADAARFQGRQSQTAGFVNAFGTVLKGASSLFDKYGRRSALSPSDFGGVEPYVDASTWGMT